MATCAECREFGLQFARAYAPEEFIEGDRGARVWIVGLNPAQDPDWQDPRSAEDLLAYFDDESRVHGYFKQFKAVSPKLYGLLGKQGGAAHTDLVKCSSMSWPPENVTTSGRGRIIANCSRYLQSQLASRAPELIICNGSEVSSEIKRLLPPAAGTPADATSYVHLGSKHRIAVVLSGFIGRIDNYSRRRLGKDIEVLLAQRGET